MTGALVVPLVQQCHVQYCHTEKTFGLVAPMPSMQVIGVIRPNLLLYRERTVPTVVVLVYLIFVRKLIRSPYTI